jgi:hypothetical protein
VLPPPPRVPSSDPAAHYCISPHHTTPHEQQGPEVDCPPEGICAPDHFLTGPGSAGPLRGRKRDIWCAALSGWLLCLSVWLAG